MPDQEQNDNASNQMDHAKIANAIRQILAAVGEDPDREGLRETPDRVARMYKELLGGLHKDPAARAGGRGRGQATDPCRSRKARGGTRGRGVGAVDSRQFRTAIGFGQGGRGACNSS